MTARRRHVARSFHAWKYLAAAGLSRTAVMQPMCIAGRWVARAEEYASRAGRAGRDRTIKGA